MQYIRGAVNAISAPYQYYKDLPPINPSTLTGAIDVIVIQRPTDSGDTELACSPFHVRFGKWQVLRPGEKKVSVSVNGHPIPFDMKIGEAGEAFFVFETDDDVPADLITSPILHPTEMSAAAESQGVETDRFGAKQKDDDGNPILENTETVQEPEFLDLDASPSTSPKQSGTAQPPPIGVTPPRNATESLPSPPPSPPIPTSWSATSNSLLERTGTKMETRADRVDNALKSMKNENQPPKVDYKEDIALDMEGYHSHDREASDRTVVEEGPSSLDFPSTSQLPPSPVRFRSSPVQSTALPKASPAPLTVPIPFPRATSEPPPDVEEGHRPSSSHPESSDISLGQPPLQEYSWEWGAFPQPSPMKAGFGKGAGTVRGKGKGREQGRLPVVDSDDDESEDVDNVAIHRSHSVPPELEGSPAKVRRELPDQDTAAKGADWDEYDLELGRNMGYGAGGRLRPSRTDPTRFGVRIEGKTSEFELSLVDVARNTGDDEDRGRRGSRSDDERSHAAKVLDGRDEVEAARLFEQGKIDYARFLEDDSIVNDDRLVIRWAGGQYITRSDDSPLMDALVFWRNDSIKAREQGAPSRPVSPLPSDLEPPRYTSDDEPLSSDEGDDPRHAPSNLPPSATRKPTSSSWVRWWSRSRNSGGPDIAGASSSRPALRGSASDPLGTRMSKTPDNLTSEELLGPSPLSRIDATPSMTPTSSAPAAPTGNAEVAAVRKRFAKTLRLTSDQLKSLNLKSGANTITFSLSASGVIACTARIFVWQSTDLVVVSDIDGTITKSDGLGHIFTMIGRDWTHLGVAKLYTDITRNGYKIMYLTSRAIGQADATRDYLKGIKQNDYELPEGPVIMSPDRLMASLHREVILRKPEVFKMACLRDIQRLFGEAARNPFYAGFGNRITDALSYRSVNVPSARIFTIDSSGEVKMELLELAGYKSSYIHMTDLVDQMFPPIHRKWAPEFTDFNYWKAPVQEFQLPDLSPPSPALSARSDTSTLARIRNFSLVGTRQTNNVKRYTMPPPSTERMSPEPDHVLTDRSAQLRQMSSFERLSNVVSQNEPSSSSTVGDKRRSLSPVSRASSSSTYLDSGSEDEHGDDADADAAAKRQRRRERRRSTESMPGSLPGSEDDMRFGVDDDHEEGDEEDDQDLSKTDEEEAAEDAFDEDFLAAGEMENVPFL